MVELAAMREASTEVGAIVEVQAIGGFPVGGHEEDGRCEGQAYVQYIRLARPGGTFPLLMSAPASC